MKQHLLGIARIAVVPVLVVAAYAGVARAVDSVFLPLPMQIFDAGRTWLAEDWARDVVPSVRNLIVGYGLGSALGAAIGLLLGRNSTLRATIEPVATFVRSIPPIALIPVFMLAMGIGDDMRIGVIATGVFFPVLVSAIDGAAGIDRALDDVVAVNRISKRDRVFSIILPGATPQILTGMKTGLSIAVIMIFTSELLGSTSGIGSFILESQRFFAIPSLWAGTLTLGALGLVLAWIFDFAETRLLKWRE